MRRTLVAMMAAWWAACCLGGASGAAVTVLLTRNGTETVFGTYPSGAAISNLPAMNSSYSRVRVFGAANDTIGVITLTGNLPSGAVLEVLIAGASVTEMPESEVGMPRAGAEWEGLNAGANVREHVRLAASVGTLSGPAEVGEVLRLDVDVIAGPVTALAEKTGEQEWTIGLVEARRRVTSAGVIRSVGGGIETVRVGAGLAGDGLFGGVIAEGGGIGEVIVAGRVQIDATTGILARDGIGTIRCTDAEAVWGPVDAVIDANTGGHSGIEHTRLGCLYTLECDTLAGVVRARFLDDALSGARRRSIRAGMVLAPIEISDTVYGSIEVFGFAGEGRLDVGGNLMASVIAEHAITTIDVGGDIDMVFACVPTEIVCTQGPIGTVLVGGKVYSQLWCELQARIWATGGIEELRIAGDMFADIAHGAYPTAAPMGVIYIGGDWLGGTINASTIVGMEVGGVMEGVLRVASLPVTSLVRVGGARSSPILITTRGGLHGQVITNSRAGERESDGPLLMARAGAGWDRWDETEYPVTSAVLGGGAVGDVPFRLHQESSVPAACEGCGAPTIHEGALSQSGLVLEFYGPVKAGGDGPALHLHAADAQGVRAPGASDFGHFLEVTFEGRRVRAKVAPGQALGAGRWVVSPVQGGIVCDRVTAGAAIEVVPFEYGFEVSGCGTADFNRDGDTGTDADIEAFFACLAGQCCEACGGADFDGDGDVGTDGDIEAFFRVLAGNPC